MMVEKLKTWLATPFPFLLNEDKRNLFLCLGVGIYLEIFMFIFHPYRQIYFQNISLFTSFITLTLVVFIIGVPRLFPSLFEIQAWTILKYILFQLFLLAIIGIIAAISIFFLGLFPGFTFSETLSRIFFKELIAYGTIPITVITLIAKNADLTQNLAHSLEANQELDKIKSIKQEISSTNTVTFHSNTAESLTINLSELLFVEADDNYVTFFWKNKGSYQKKLMRMNLISVEKQINNSLIIRCHRSYMVNINFIESISGNTNGYKLKIEGSEMLIPMSRTKGNEIISKIRLFRSAIELDKII
jgi:hypothetical protein